MKLIPSTLLIALLSFSHLASAADKAPQPNAKIVQLDGAPGPSEKSNAIQPTSTTLQVSGGLTMYPIGDTFFALLPKVPVNLETPADFIKNHITPVMWKVADSRSLGEGHKFGLGLKSPTDSGFETPTFIHVSGLPKSFELNATAQFQLSDKGNLVVIINKEAYPVLLKKDMKITSTTSGADGSLALTKNSK